VNPFTRPIYLHVQPTVLLPSAFRTPPSAFSIRPNRRRIIQQEIPRTTQRVIRIRRLSNRRPRIEVVILIATRPTAAERTAVATRPRTATAVSTATPWTNTIRLAITAIVLAVALMARLIPERMLMPIAAPVTRAARRAIIRTRRILRSTFRALVPIEHAAISTRASRFDVAAVPRRPSAAFAAALRPRCVFHGHHVT